MTTNWKPQDLISIHVKATPSCLFNNLTSDGKNVAFIHGSEVFVVPEVNIERPLQSSAAQISSKDGRVGQSVRFVQAGDNNYLVIASMGGVQIFEGSSNRLVLFHGLDDSRKNPKTSFFARGVAAAKKEEKNIIVAGTSYGDILTFDVSGSVSFMSSTAGHAHAVTAIATSISDPTRFASADDNGTIIVWNANDFSSGKITGSGDPCTGLAFTADNVVASFGSGRIRIYSIKSLRVIMEISAHSAWINALTLHPSGKFCATAGEDSIVSVWTLPHGGEYKVNCAFSTSVRDRLLTGVEFCGPERKYLAVSAYDTENLIVWKQ
eukprot:TRINITY_DN1211_c0_g2_i1.p1 TRINITY_DN1211_c0_g2~~TRINITY_DN1211_c0_g2_i1.p1  ORF type:complete len:322 (+),score=60.92 TRINITY_DN1211_c0_g2_i1:80-1045(+)